MSCLRNCLPVRPPGANLEDLFLASRTATTLSTQASSTSFASWNDEKGFDKSSLVASFLKSLGLLRTAGKNLWEILDKEGKSFRSNLQPQDVQTIKLARLLFHSCSVIPAILYYAGTVERPPKFPATISYTIRKGWPQKAQLILWMSGWACMFRVIKQRSSSLIRKFCTQMFWTGVWTTCVFKVGRGPISDKCHFVGAATYMLDHMVLFKVLNTRPVFRKLFLGSFAVMAYSLQKVKAIEQITGLVMESSDYSPKHRQRVLNRFPRSLRRSLFRWELLVMLFENLLFVSFVQGMPSGLLQPKEQLLVQKEDNDNTPKEELQTGKIQQYKYCQWWWIYKNGFHEQPTQKNVRTGLQW